MAILDDINELNAAVPQAAPKPELKEVSQEVAPVNPQWTRFRPKFVEAMEGGLYTIEGLERSINQGRSVFFPGVNAALVGERVAYESGKNVFQVTWAVGDLKELKQLSYGVEAVARLMGCSEMLIEGREGWKRELKDLGYEPWSITVRKVL